MELAYLRSGGARSAGAGSGVGIYKPRAVLAPMILLVLMLASTAYSQYVIIPQWSATA